MNTNRGATLVELMISILIIMIVSLGFFNWLGTVMRMNTSIERSNTAYAMANDVAGRLQRMNDNTLIQKKSGSTDKCVGYDTVSGNIGECRTGGLIDCNGGTVTTGVLAGGTTGTTAYTDPKASGSTPYLSASSACEGKTWLDSACRAGSTITAAANAKIDHPNSTSGTPDYDSINPIRSIKNTTYYAVWSVAYIPCNAGTNTDRRKIFITVYWIEGSSTIKGVSLTVDKTIGAET